MFRLALSLQSVTTQNSVQMQRNQTTGSKSKETQAEILALQEF
jgi:hypothetical protein